MSQKTASKYGKSGIFVLFCIKIEGGFKKRSLTVSAAFGALSHKKEIFYFIKYNSPVFLQIRCQTYILKKNEKDFIFFKKCLFF